MADLFLCGIEPESIVDGPGFRYVVFTQGCPHHCKGCHNPQTHPFTGGFKADIDKILSEISENPLLSGITLSGGEPFCQAEALIPLVKKVREMKKNVIAYSGYTLDQLENMSVEKHEIGELLRMCDMLVDGKFIEEQRDLTLKFRGSRNQRIIILKNYFENGEIKTYD